MTAAPISVFFVLRAESALANVIEPASGRAGERLTDNFLFAQIR